MEIIRIAPLLFFSAFLFLQPSYALKLMSCHSSQQTTTEDLSHGLGWRWSSKWWNVLTFCYSKISRFRHHRKCSTWASKKKKVLHTLLCTIPRFIVCQCIFLHTFEYVEHHSWQGIHFNGEWAAWKWYVKIFFVCMNPKYCKKKSFIIILLVMENSNFLIFNSLEILELHTDIHTLQILTSSYALCSLEVDAFMCVMTMRTNRETMRGNFRISIDVVVVSK